MENASTVKLTKSLDRKIVREFQKSFIRDWDKNFALILLLVVLVEVLFVTILAWQPVPPVSEKERARIEERFVRLLMPDKDVFPENNAGQEFLASSESTGVSAGDETVSEVDVETVEDGGGGEAGIGSVSRRSAESRMAERRANASVRREEIREEVSTKGVLAQLTGTGSASRGLPVSNPFLDGENSIREDLDQLLSKATGLKSKGRSGFTGTGGTIRGERSQRQATIDDVVSDLGSRSSSSFSRKGKIASETAADVKGVGRKSIYRSQSAIHEVIYSHLSAIQSCYERGLRKNPSLKGKVELRITVNPKGHVTNVEIISSTLNNPEVEDRILQVIGRWKDFPPIDEGEGDIKFRQTFAFGY
jgi:TonB family protein